MKKNLFLLLILFAFCACTDESNEEKGKEDNPVDYVVNGKVEKGPFIKGSTVTLQPLDSKLNLVGTIFSATIKDNEGNFDFGSLRLSTPYALLTTNGFFYNEVRDKLSDAQITLQAVVDLTDNSTVNVNILTHLKKDRLKKLVDDGSSYADANKQTQTELLTNFGLQKYADTDVSRFSITSGTNEAAALIVVSSVLLKGNSEAQLTEELATMTQELIPSGKLPDERVKAYREKAIGMKDWYREIQDNIVRRYDNKVTVKDLTRYVDWDNDGIAGNEFGDTDGPVQMKFEKEELIVPSKGGVFTVKIESNAPYTFTKPGPKDDLVFPSESTVFNSDTISFTKKVENEVLTLTMKPASAAIMEVSKIKLYSLDGTLHSVLTVKQEGDASQIETLLTPNGKQVFNEVLGRMSNVKNTSHTIEALYTKLYTTSDYSLKNFVTPPVSPDNRQLDNLWSRPYVALRYIRAIQSLLVPSTELYSYATCWEAMLYYDMAVFWENVLYVEEVDINYRAKQYPSKQLFAKFEKELKFGVDNFEDKKGTFSTVEDYFIMPKDVARMVLAKMYMYQKEYAKATPLLEAVIQSNHYKIDASRSEALSVNSQELIYGLQINQYGDPDNYFDRIESGDYYLPVATYTEALLSAAECAFRLNDTDKAKTYLDQVITARSLSAASGDFMTSLKTVWKSELKATNSYFAFLKRNGLATSELSLKEYQLILPIPESQLSMSFGINQNPGYN